MKNFSYKDISKLAGVSISTVSRYYNNGYISKNTKIKIEAIVKEHGYFPNHGARLIRGRDSSIFVIVPEWYRQEYSYIIQGIEQGAIKGNYKVIITHSPNDSASYIETIKYVSSWKPGAIVFFLPDDDDNKITNYITSTSFHSNILVYGKEVEGIHWIKIDEEAAFNSLTHKFIQYIENPLKEKIIFAEDEKLTAHEKEFRKNGFKAACEKQNIQYEIWPIKTNDYNNVQDFLSKLNVKNHVNVVSSTHSVFSSLISSNDKNLLLTDIGWVTTYDYQRRYKAKIFIDYVEIGIRIDKLLFGSPTPQSNNVVVRGTGEVFKPQIIYQDNKDK